MTPNQRPWDVSYSDACYTLFRWFFETLLTKLGYLKKNPHFSQSLKIFVTALDRELGVEESSHFSVFDLVWW